MAGRTSQRRTLCCLGRTLGRSVGIYRAAIPITFLVSRELREIRKAPSSLWAGSRMSRDWQQG